MSVVSAVPGPRPPVTGGPVPELRLAGPSDRPAVRDMLLRCSARTVRLRFHGVVDGFPEPYLTNVLDGRSGHFGLVGVTDGAVTALASCVPVTRDTADVSILVEDAGQGRGLGSTLLRRLVLVAGRRGFRTLTASFLAEQVGALRVLRSYGLRQTRLGGGVVEVTFRPEARIEEAGPRG